MIHIIDNSNREWADAPDLDNAMFAMAQIGAEERTELRAVDENGKVLAWCFMSPLDGPLIQWLGHDAYEPDDPKSEGYHDRMADIWDMREGK